MAQFVEKDFSPYLELSVISPAGFTLYPWFFPAPQWPA